MRLTFCGGAEEVTGSCHLVEVRGKRLLLDCGLIQGSREDEARNREPFPFAPGDIDAVVLSHAHIDHSGRIPLLVKSGFRGPIYTQAATRDLCRIMLKDAGHLNEKEAEWSNRKRERKGLSRVNPLYTLKEAQQSLRRFKPLPYRKRIEVLPGAEVRLLDAGHILGSAIVELWLSEDGVTRKLVFSGDLGHPDAPILRNPTAVEQADVVLLESTYGDRLHRPREETQAEIAAVVEAARHARGNILIPAFAVGRTQEILYVLGQNFDRWGLAEWEVFLDSPMAIEATEVYTRHSDLYDDDASTFWDTARRQALLPNLHLTHTTHQSMKLNQIRSGAIIIAASGMCTGGRIRHHLKNNVWRKGCHLVIVGFQARGTLGRALVDGAREIRLWGETIRVAATVHTIGGLSAHADQRTLSEWALAIGERPSIFLVHGEQEALGVLRETLAGRGANAHIARRGFGLDLVTGKTFR